LRALSVVLTSQAVPGGWVLSEATPRSINALACLKLVAAMAMVGRMSKSS